MNRVHFKKIQLMPEGIRPEGFLKNPSGLKTSKVFKTLEALVKWYDILKCSLWTLILNFKF
jgi:hypothetical protein